MKKSSLAELALGLVCLVLGTEVVLLWPLIFLLGGVGLLILGISLVSDSNEHLKSSLKQSFPFRVENLFRFPRLPYFQTGMMILILIASLFSILPSGYSGFILVLVGLAVSQFGLNISKKNIKSQHRIMIVLQFQIFVFFSTFIYVNFEISYLFGMGPAYLSSIFLFFAWFAEFLYLYFNLLK